MSPPRRLRQPICGGSGRCIDEPRPQAPSRCLKAPQWLHAVEREPGPIRLGFAQRRDLAHRLRRAACQRLVGAGAFDLPRQFLLGDRTDDPCRHVGGQHAWRDLETGLDEGAGGDDRGLADDRVVHHHGVHPDQGVAADTAAVQHGTVADVSVDLDHRVGARETVHHAGVLQVRTILQHEPAEVAAQARRRTHIAAGADQDVADQDGGRSGAHRRSDEPPA